MNVRHFVTLFALTVFSGIAIAQRATHPEPKPPEAKTPAPAAATHESAPAEHKPAAPSHSTASAARFQAVAASLKLSNRQQKGIAGLIQSTRKELAKIQADRSLTPQQRQKAEQAVNSTLAQKFVGLLTTQQKKDLEAVLLKQTQKGKGSTANSNSAANSGSGGGGSSPDIPSVDAPGGGDSGDSGTSSSSSTASSSSPSADTPASADASKSSSTSDSTSDSTSASDKATVAASSATVAAPPPGMVTSKVSQPSPAPAKKGRLSDAQLAAILDSFVQDEGSDSAKPSVPSGPGSGS
jgi:hypothetical protein